MVGEVVHRICGSTSYAYADEILILDAPSRGENHTLVYPWTLCLPEGVHEQGLSYFFYHPRGPCDDTDVRDAVAYALFRMHEREMKRECTPPWRRSPVPLLVRRLMNAPR